MVRDSALRCINALYNTNLPGTAKAARFLARIFFGTAPESIIISTIYGFQIFLKPSEDSMGLENEIFYLGTYERGTISVMRQFLLPGENFVDVGANIGFISISAAQVLGEGTIWAFEPNPEAREILEKNIALNNIRNIKVLPYALGSSEGQGEIFINAIAHNRGGATLLDIEKEKRKDGKTYSVEIKRLDKLLPENFSLAMIKIDVEGFEMEVLKGAEIWLRRKDAPALIVECSLERNTTNFSGVDLFKYIKSLNEYLIFKLAKGKNRLSKLQEIKNEKDLPRHDNIFCILPEHLPRLKSMIKIFVGKDIKF